MLLYCSFGVQDVFIYWKGLEKWNQFVKQVLLLFFSNYLCVGKHQCISWFNLMLKKRLQFFAVSHDREFHRWKIQCFCVSLCSLFLKGFMIPGWQHHLCLAAQWCVSFSGSKCWYDNSREQMVKWEVEELSNILWEI